ncbi:MAG TPA: DNA topoisomerase 4 subunit A [Oligoflexia bacterium]|nr:DNA topoisomerase 4 subunit A [Oligoflexia bacterium]HMP49636.1 DNA topoisomerase 4 subunit A [Oligoflexia bacterium]
MSVEIVDIIEESRSRYLTYALSVVTSRAIPDVRDGLKPVQRRIIYAMLKNLSLLPGKNYRKSAAVVGEVLGRYHPHGDAACYEAMVRMAQDFSLRYPLVDGQGNFGSLDGDGAAAYRYTEAKLRELAIELLGDIDSNTVSFRENFDQTTEEPVVLPSRIPNLLMNGATGIAVGMATSIPPHNLVELCDALEALVSNPDISDSKIHQLIKGPDFPTACEILNSKQEMKELYSTGRGAIRMRATWHLETTKPKGMRNERRSIVFDSIPYGVDKSVLVEKLADVIISKKITQIEDVRDESTEEIRIVLDLAHEAEEEKILAYLFKSTQLQCNFPVNLTALVPSGSTGMGRPVLLSLRSMLEEFVLFRLQVIRNKLEFERLSLEERVHVLKGVSLVLDVLEEVIREVRKSSSRGDAVSRLVKMFSLTQKQAEFIVDLRVYQLTRTHLEEVISELAEKEARVHEILRILSNDSALRKEVTDDISRIKKQFGDKRRSRIVSDFEIIEVSEVDLIQDEEVYVIVTKDAWLKRIKSSNDPAGTRLRDGDSILFSGIANSRDILTLYTNLGMSYSVEVFNLTSTSGYGEPMQKIFKCADGENVVCALLHRGGVRSGEVLVYSSGGVGYIGELQDTISIKKGGKRIIRLRDGDTFSGIVPVSKKQIVAFVTNSGYCLCVLESEIPRLGLGSKGVHLIKLSKGDELVGASTKGREDQLEIFHSKGKTELAVRSFTIGKRGNKGDKIPVARIGKVSKVL